MGTTAPPPDTLTTRGRYAILVIAFLGWFWAGMHMSTTQLTGMPASVDLLACTGELDRDRYAGLKEIAKTEGG